VRADASVQFLPETTAAVIVAAQVTRNNGEPIVN